MRSFVSPFVFVFAGLVATTAMGQSTNSNDPFEIFVGKGTLGVFLPSYDLGTSSTGGSAFQDDLDVPGFSGQLRTIKRFLGTRTSFETRWFYGIANANSLGNGDIDFANPATGAAESFSGGRAHLGSDLDHYGCDIALRDTWQTKFGGLSAGTSFSYFTFDQEFETSYDRRALFQESLESDFLGGKALLGWDGWFLGRATNLDLAVGGFDVNADYDFKAREVAGNRKAHADDITATVEFWATRRAEINWGEIAISLGALYINDMPQIVHAPGSVATIGSDDAMTAQLLFEFIF
jgi:hypothetical protein